MTKKKRNFFSLNGLNKSLKNEQIDFLNINKKINNYVYNSKYKIIKSSKQDKKSARNKKLSNKTQIKKPEVKKYKMYEVKHIKDYWNLKTEGFIFKNTRHIVVYCS